MTAVALDIRPGTSTTYPAGPPFLPRLVTGRMFRQNATDSMTDSARRYGDLVGSGANSKNSTPYGGVKEVRVASFPSFLHIER